MADADSFDQFGARRDLRQRLLELRVEQGLKVRIERDKDFVGGRGDGRILEGALRTAGKLNDVGFMGSGNSVDGIVDGGVQQRETTRGMEGRRLRSRRPNDPEQGPVPLNHRIDGYNLCRETCRLRPETCAEEHQRQKPS